MNLYKLIATENDCYKTGRKIKPTTSGYNTTPLFVMPLGFRPLSHFPLGVGTAASGSDVALPTIGYVNQLGQAIVVHQGTLPSQIKIFGGTYIAG